MHTVKNKELITELSNRLGWNIQDVTDMLAAFGTVVAGKLLEGDVLSLPGFGQFEAKKKMERISVNPINKKRYLVPPKLVPVFKPGSTVKAKLKELGDNEQ